MLSAGDPLGFLWSIGIAAANFELRHYDHAVRGYQPALAGQPKAVWINFFRAPALSSRVRTMMRSRVYRPWDACFPT